MPELSVLFVDQQPVKMGTCRSIEEKYAKERVMFTSNGFTAAAPSVPMQPQAPYFREAGSGTPVVCIHSSASSSGQWRALMERLADRFRVIAVDLYGSGKTAAWPQDHPMHLDDELTLLSSVFRAAGDRFHLIGHSFGAAIALKAALADRDRLLSLVLYEPALFSVLMADATERTAAREIHLRFATIRYAWLMKAISTLRRSALSITGRVTAPGRRLRKLAGQCLPQRCVP
jgi:pimeloyl-ACP methyl ester carboxylesterase